MSLQRFMEAQEAVYPYALAELQAGEKCSHWMWFIFPQISGLGRSEASRFYALDDAREARAYLAHPLLGERLDETTRTILSWAGRRTLENILGGIDALKFASSMTLFEAVGGGSLFFEALEAMCNGARDARTLALLRD